MTNDKIEEIFGSLDQYYPGSKKKRRSQNPEVEKKRQEAAERQSWSLNPQVKTLGNGKQVELFSAGTFALALGRPLVTVRLWERKGYIPKAPYRLKSIIVDGEKKPGWRMYSRAMIESALQSFQSRGLLEAPRIDWDRHRDLSLEIFENWVKIHNQETE
jgi:hypothetical protein